MNTAVLPRRHTSPLRLLAAFVLGLLAVFASGTVANAHDELIGSTPEHGSTVTEAPSEITLNFSGTLQTLADGGGTVVVISSEAGEQIENTFEVKGRDVAITPATELIDGQYTVASRVISSDGHPIEKSVSFTVQTGTAAEPTASEASETAASQPAADSTDGAVQSTPTQESDPAAGINPVWWIVIGVAVAGAAIAVLVNFSRRGNTK